MYIFLSDTILALHVSASLLNNIFKSGSSLTATNIPSSPLITSNTDVLLVNVSGYENVLNQLILSSLYNITVLIYFGSIINGGDPTNTLLFCNGTVKAFVTQNISINISL